MHKLTFLFFFCLAGYFGSVFELHSAEENQTNELVEKKPEFEPTEVTTPDEIPPNEPASQIELQTSQETDQLSNDGIENSKNAIYQGAVGFANWVDTFFGDRQELEDASYDYLRLVNSLVLREGENPKYRTRIKAKVHLPQFRNKTSLLFSNDSATSNDNFESEENKRNTLNDDNNESLSAAINYETEVYAKSKFDFRVGIDSSIDTFAFIKHSMPLYDSEDLQIQNFNYLFWEEEQGFGLKTQLELNKVLDEKTLFRWKYSILRAEKSDGNEWYNRFSLVNQISEERWIAYELGFNGDTVHRYKVENYRFSVRLRSQTSVDWLYLEIEPEIRYIRTPDFFQRELIAGLIVKLEVQFEKN